MVHIDYAFDMATSALKFKAAIPQSVKSVLINNAKAEILSTLTPDFIEVEGKNVLVYRDKNGLIVNNKENKLNPYTTVELISEKLKEVLDTGVNRQGGGTGSSNVHSNNNSELDLSSAKTQLEADELITKHLLAKGLTRINPQFAIDQAKIRKENNVSKLPMR